MKPIYSAFSVIIMSAFFGCSTVPTHSRSSNVAFLEKQEKPLVAMHGAIVSDLTRSATVQKWQPLAGYELLLSPEYLDRKGDRYARLSDGQRVAVDPYSPEVLVSVLPYTRPLIESEIADRAFKENWSKERANLELKKILAERIENKTCFDVSISCNQSLDAVKFRYWFAKLIQGEITSDLNFSEIKIFSERRDTILNAGNIGQSIPNYSYFAKAVACTERDASLARTFSVIMEPRFDHNLVKVRLDWLEPNGAQKTSQKK